MMSRTILQCFLDFATPEANGPTSKRDVSLTYSTTQPFLVLSLNAPPHKRLLRIEPHSFPAVSQ